MQLVFNDIDENKISDLKITVNGCSPNVKITADTECTLRIESALKFLSVWGQTDGNHHKAWVIDQVVRALCGCHYNETNESFYPNHEYNNWVSDYCYLDGEYEYEWDIGIEP